MAININNILRYRLGLIATWLHFNQFGRYRVNVPQLVRNPQRNIFTSRLPIVYRYQREQGAKCPSNRGSVAAKRENCFPTH